MISKVSIGNIHITAYQDFSPPPFDPTIFFDDTTLTDWEPYSSEYLNEQGLFQTNFVAWLIQWRDQNILIDTGIGSGDGGILPTVLQQDSIDLREIDTVVLTHLHPDHIGWTLTKSGDTIEPTFPNATYLVPQLDWDYFTSNRDPLVQTNIVPLETLGVLQLIDGPHSITSSITTYPTPGHTPGHTSVLLNSNNEKGIVVGDVFHSAVQIIESDWCATFDADKPKARATRNDVLTQCENEDITICASHLLMGKNIGKIHRTNTQRYWAPI